MEVITVHALGVMVYQTVARLWIHVRSVEGMVQHVPLYPSLDLPCYQQPRSLGV